MTTTILTDPVRHYETLDVKSMMTIAEAAALSLELAQRLRSQVPPPDCVVGIANGGLFTAKIVARELGIPLHVVTVRRRGSLIKQRLSTLQKRLRIPPAVINAGPLRPLWRLFQRHSSGLEVQADDFALDLHGQVVAIVDDCMESGASLRRAREMLATTGARTLTTAVLCWYRGIGDSGAEAPDLYLHHTVHFYPWSASSQHFAEFKRWIADNGLVLSR